MHSWNDAENRRRGCRNKWTGVSLEDNIIMPYDRTAWHKISYATITSDNIKTDDAD